MLPTPSFAADPALGGRDFLREADFTRGELASLVTLAAALKRAHRSGTEVQQLAGKSIALVFEKSSTRTRCSFEVAAFQQGAHTTLLDSKSSQIGHKESIPDTARFLSRLYDAIQFRGAEQATVDALAEYSDVPVYNGLTDEWHPTQSLADLLTMVEQFDGDVGALAGLPYCYLGDARNNMGNSMLVTAAVMGADFRIAAPRALWPTEPVQELARQRATVSGATLTITEDPLEALAGARFVHTDVWVSLGEPEETWVERVEVLRPYRVDAAALASTGVPDVQFMHCLPSLHDLGTEVGRRAAQMTGWQDGIEVADEVFESPASLVFDQAENRMHTIKALMVATLSG
jgi:ornithine carbamoyltransferase